uniref:HCO3_cotransp domain-containing protein n=1 Tax=Macrostomum lignano TaxID=282301 RepID=A0A1I8HGP4_9PLAT
YITRFTEESFAGLIALIFIVEAFKKLLKIENHYPVNTGWHPNYRPDFNCSCIQDPEVNQSNLKPLPPGQNLRVPSYPAWRANASQKAAEPRYFANYSAMNYWTWDWFSINKACTQNQGLWLGSGCGTYAVPDVFFFSCLLFIGTFAISYGLKMMRNSGFFPNFVRSLISDFAVMLAIVFMTLADRLMGLHTPKLDVPTIFEPTLGYETRGWLITPLGRRNQNPWYTIVIALFPALLATILIFMDQQITAVIVNRKENKLKKGLGYHLDLLVVAVLIGVNSVLGIPWFVAATVLSINHVMSLKIESESTAPGERPKFLGCRENRLTGFMIFLLIGLSVFMTPVLQNIPMPVLYGVFLFMGVSSLNGIQLVQRIGLFFMPQKYQPDYIYLRHVKLTQVHKFTIIQVLCLVLLWVVKAIKKISILFPIMVLAMCFVRKALDYLFDQTELKWLDDIMPPMHLGRKQKPGTSDSAGVGATSQSPTVGEPKAGEGQFNVSVELGQTSIWRNLTAGSGADDKKKAKGRGKSSAAAGKNRSQQGATEDPAGQEVRQSLLNAPAILLLLLLRAWRTSVYHPLLLAAGHVGDPRPFVRTVQRVPVDALTVRRAVRTAAAKAGDHAATGAGLLGAAGVRAAAGCHLHFTSSSGAAHQQALRSSQTNIVRALVQLNRRPVWRVEHGVGALGVHFVVVENDGLDRARCCSNASMRCCRSEDSVTTVSLAGPSSERTSSPNTMLVRKSSSSSTVTIFVSEFDGASGEWTTAVTAALDGGCVMSVANGRFSKSSTLPPSPLLPLLLATTTDTASSLTSVTITAGGGCCSFGCCRCCWTGASERLRELAGWLGVAAPLPLAMRWRWRSMTLQTASRAATSLNCSTVTLDLFPSRDADVWDKLGGQSGQDAFVANAQAFIVQLDGGLHIVLAVQRSVNDLLRLVNVEHLLRA